MTPPPVNQEDYREMVTLLRDVRERVVAIETTVDHIREHGSVKANTAHEIAENAATDILDIRSAQTWTWRAIGTATLGLVANILFQPFS